MEDPFLSEKWQELASHETEDLELEQLTERREKTAQDAYTTIKKIKEHGKMASELVRNVQEAVARYIKTIDRLSASRIKKDDAMESAEADLARRLAHEALISNLNILNRYCIKNKLDTSWKSVIGSDRNQVRDWALMVAPEIIQERIG